MDEVDDKVLVTVFTNELCFREFLYSVYKNYPKMMTNMLYRATNYVNVENTMIARGGKTKKRERQDDPRLDGQALEKTTVIQMDMPL